MILRGRGRFGTETVRGECGLEGSAGRARFLKLIWVQGRLKIGGREVGVDKKFQPTQDSSSCN